MNSTMGFMTTLQILKYDLFNDYDNSLAPVHHKGAFEQGFMENFSMVITYAKLTDVNERSMEFSFVLGMMLMWSDPRLAWDPAKYNNVSHFYMTIDQLWFPNFHPCESSSITYLSREEDQVANIFPNGDIRTICQAEIVYSCGFDDMSEWRVQINNITYSFNYCSHDLCQSILHYSIILSRNPQFWIGLVIVPIFMLGFLILIGLFFSGQENFVNNAIGFGLTTMTSMMVVVGILNDSLSKIESIPCLRIFVLIQISVTSVAVITVLITDKMRRTLSTIASNKQKGSSRWMFIRSISRDERILRNNLFIIFAFLHLANFIWLLYNQKNRLPYVLTPAQATLL